MGRKKKGQYRVRIQLFGKRWNKYFNTQEEANEYKEKVYTQRLKGYKKGEVTHKVLATYFQEFLNEKKLEVEGATIPIYRSGFNLLKPLWNTWLYEIDKESVIECLLREDTIHYRTSGVAMYVLVHINNIATLNNDGLAFDPLPLKQKINVNATRGQKSQAREYHTLEEVRKIMDFMLNPPQREKVCYHWGTKDFFRDNMWTYHIYRLGVFTGARIGEMCSFKRKNYSKEHRTLKIESGISKQDKDLVIDPENGEAKWEWEFYDKGRTKNKLTRTIKLSRLACESIDYLIENYDSEFIIPPLKDKADFCLTRDIRDEIKRTCDHLKIIAIGTHGAFRKTFATQIATLSKKNFRDMIASIQKHLGHKSPMMTLRYVQAIETELDDELDDFDNAI